MTSATISAILSYMTNTFHVIAEPDVDPTRFAEAFAAFMLWYQQMEETRYANSTCAPVVTCESGSKNIRIVTEWYGSRSSSCAEV